ncbi:MAG: hypothetical protein CMM46_01590 [Rhodospirillaceae bacterium]|nr:hypothetical protein [Rhodospirillaceae bacterium]|tara:strand:+ start:812 stop:1177 length:366 start_codon:yes stop_codon:yes gene_type:complete
MLSFATTPPPRLLVILSVDPNEDCPVGVLHLTNTKSMIDDMFLHGITHINDGLARRFPVISSGAPCNLDTSYGDKECNVAIVLMADCASEPDNYFDSSESPTLEAAFYAIGNECSNPRIGG